MNVAKLREAVETRGVMYKFIAEKSGLARSTVSKTIHGLRQHISVDEAKGIALALRLSWSEINEIFFDGMLPEAQSESVNRKRSIVKEDN